MLIHAPQGDLAGVHWRIRRCGDIIEFESRRTTSDKTQWVLKMRCDAKEIANCRLESLNAADIVMLIRRLRENDR